MKTVIKIALGVILGLCVLIGGCVALLGAGASEVDKQSKKVQREIDSAGPATEDAGTRAASDVKTLDVGRATGDFAIAQASGTSENPKSLRLLVSSAPPQKASVSYSLTCSQGAGAGSKGGQFNAVTPTSRKLPTPGDPDSCIVSANAQLETGGRVKVTIKG